MCDAAADLLVKDLKMKSAVIFSEDAAWTTPLDAEYETCAPKVGLKILDHIRFSADTTDFTPIFNKIEGEHPDVMLTGVSHVGVQPIVQWASQQVPTPLFGVNSQATTNTFWKDTNGAAEGVAAQAIAVPNVALSPKTIPFATAYIKRFGASPSYCGYTSYDAVYYIADAIKRAGSTDADKMVDALEKTDWVGTIGRITFLGHDDLHTHAIRTGAGYVTGVMTQWHDGQPNTVWPANLANAKLSFPAFVKLPAATN
jgi:branched-chain amino acid transport system substrate-binding protein